MTIDSSIYANIQQPQVQNPLNALASYAQVQNALNENALMPLKMQALQLTNSKAQQQYDILKDYLSDDSQNTQSSGATNALTSDGAGNFLTPTSTQFKKLKAYAAAGLPGAKELIELYKYQNDGSKKDANAYYTNPVTGKTQYYPDPKSGITIDPNTNTVSILNGAPQALGAISGAQAAATEGAKPLPLGYVTQGPDGKSRPIGGTVGQYLGQNQAPQAGNGPQGLDLSKLAPQQQAALAQRDPQAFANGVQDFQNTSANPGAQGASGYTPPSTGPDGTPVPPQVQQQLAALAQSKDPAKLQQFSAAVMGKLSQMPDSPQKQNAMQGLNSEIGKIQQSWQQGQQAAPQQGGLPPLQSASEAQQEKATVERQNAPGLAYATGASKNMADYEKSLNDRVSTGNDLIMRIEESRNALQKFQAGGGSETRVGLAKAAQAVGAPAKLVDSIAGGNLSAAQEFQKLSAQQAMETLKQALGGSGRITQAEFKVFQQNNPNLDTDPRAIEKIYNFGTKVFQRDKAEQDALSNYKQVPGSDITQFPNYWANQLQSQGIVNPQQVTGQAKGASALPSLSVKTAADYARIPSGATYTAPDGTVRRKP